MCDAAGLSSSVETVQREVQAAHSHAGAHWREAIHLQGEFLYHLKGDSVMLGDCQMGSKGLALMSDCPLKSDPWVSLVI